MYCGVYSIPILFLHFFCIKCLIASLCSIFRQRSSVSPPPPHHYRTEESSSTESYSVYHHMLTQSVASHQNLRNSPPPQYAHAHSVTDLQTQHDAPLNLSITNSSEKSSSSPQARPSVITCAPVMVNGRYENGSNRSPSPSGRREVSSG